MKNFRKILCAGLVLAMTVPTISAYAQRRANPKGQSKGKDRVKLDKAKIKAKKTGTGSTTTGLRKKNTGSSLQESMNAAVERGLVDQAKVTKIQEDIESLRNTELKDLVNKNLKSIIEIAKKENLSQETKDLIKSGMEFIAAMKGLETQFKTSNSESTNTRQALEVLLETLPKAMAWEAAKQQKLGEILKTVVKGKIDLQKGLEQALAEANISRKELIDKCKG